MNQTRFTVLHIIDHLGLGGAQSFLFDLVKAQKLNSIINPVVCCLTEETRLSRKFKDEKLSLYHLNVNRKNIFEISKIPYQIIKMIREQNCEIVHSHLFYSGFFGRIAAVLTGVPSVMHEQRNERSVTNFAKRLVDYVLSLKTDAIICVSETTKDFNIQMKKIDQKKIHVIPNGIDLSKLPIRLERLFCSELLDELGLDNIQYLVIGAGRLEPEKRFDVFINAASIIKNRIPNVGFIIVGEGSERENLEEQAKRTGLSDVVVFAGARSDILEVFDCSDVFVLTSDFEGTPLTLLEALAMGVPAVVTNVDGSFEVLKDGMGGMLVPRGDFALVAEKVIDFLSSRELRKNMGREGRRLIEQKYSIGFISKQIEHLYIDILNKRRA